MKMYVRNIGKEEFVKGCELYNYYNMEREEIYRKAIKKMSEFWDNPVRVTKAIRTLIEKWNPYYVYFDQDRLSHVIEANLKILNEFRKRDCFDMSERDLSPIRDLFSEFLHGMERIKDGSQSAVSASEALHLMSPGFFPLWNHDIAKGYYLEYHAVRVTSKGYAWFCLKMSILAQKVNQFVPDNDEKTVLKRIHEHAHAKYVMGVFHRFDVKDG